MQSLREREEQQRDGDAYVQHKEEAAHRSQGGRECQDRAMPTHPTQRRSPAAQGLESRQFLGQCRGHRSLDKTDPRESQAERRGGSESKEAEMISADHSLRKLI